MAVSDIVKQYEDEQGNVYYKMKTHDIEVQATQNSGLAPVITYFMGDKEITDDIRSLRFSPRTPSSYIQDYDEFQTMLYAKEQRAINELYEQMSIKPKNMSSGKQLLWSFFVIVIAMLPLLVAIWWYN
ncbi:sodium:proton antiporter [Lysinibacillus sp. CNPSo 3705]|uniref:sodium:proton antiporter n=1 Tax=Lysinibacillus sp. CNPSo 3705 TaxID=3028148 RepID=UPI001045FAF7|nr:sodium:proton antiporter [Lysinibacillus sp. CNPSo 3705]MDD1502535.1 sodium:proton antiporter [Lysinibacillus sp. CNPSo 3705]